MNKILLLVRKNLLVSATIGFLIISLIAGLSYVFAGDIKIQYNKIFGTQSEYSNTLDIVNNVRFENLNKSHCEILIADDIQKYTGENGPMRQKISEYISLCDNKYTLSKAVRSISFCKRIIAGKQEDFYGEYINTGGFEEVKNSCIEQYLTVSFTGGTLFNPNNDFKSDIIVNFGLPFYYDTANPSSQEYIDHRTASKERLISMLEITPSVELSIDDVELYSQKGILSLNLLPETEYTISLKSYDSEIEGEQMKATPMTLITPEYEYFGLKRSEGVTLVADSEVSNFELLSYNNDKQNTSVKICRIPNEIYAKIEVLEETSGMQDIVDEFFTSGIDTIESFDCKTKELSFVEQDSISPLIKKQSFNFESEIGNPARSGLYYVTFANGEDRKLYERVQEPLFFGVIDSHITMKVSKTGDAFFFVNDLNGEPLAGQTLRVYSNEFREKDSEYDETQKKSIETYFSPLEEDVFSSGAVLGQTNEQGVLQVNIDEKVSDYFNKTLSSWNFNSNGIHNSFFVTSSSDTNLSYVSSKWNGGITPWNFGYSMGSWWGSDDDGITLNQDSNAQKYVGHMFTDRRLYLPGEEVYLKTVIRNFADLSIPNENEFTLYVQDSAGKEILNELLSVGEYGSISQKIDIADDATLGNYTVYLKDGNDVILSTGFTVEIFQNPKFENEVMLEVTGLNEELVKINETEIEVTKWGYERETYVGNFNITATIDSQYYSGTPVANASVDYKVYKQYYYDESYWSDCFYGCYWEPEKEFYTEGTGSLDAAGKLQVKIPVEFRSNYDDYKYIVEATVTDTTGDVISGTNSIIARLPSMYKRWNPNNKVEFSLENRFYESGETVKITGGLGIGKFTSEYENQDIFIIKKKEYYTDYVKDVRGYERPRTKTQEIVKEVLLVNSENFVVGKDGKLSLNYKIEETGEYIFEYGKINPGILQMTNEKTPSENINDVVNAFQETKNSDVYFPEQTFGVTSEYEVLDFLVSTCDDGDAECDYSIINDTLSCNKYLNENRSEVAQIQQLCENKEGEITMNQKISVNQLIIPYEKKFFSIVSYGDEDANNPVQSDNKITVLTEKFVYNIGDTAKILVRLPFSGGKILWTEEKDSVIHSEYINVPGNIFFKEITVTDKHLPNTYVGVVAIDASSLCPTDISLDEGDNNSRFCIPEYKVGYTEIIGDKTQKKNDVTVSSDKDEYEPRETVKLDIQTDKKVQSELTVMVVDDSLIALMGNIDMNVLEKIYKKLPFQMQTSITNIAMLANYYFSRQGIVGGSGFGDFKGGDSAVSSRTIFKNTAFYKADLITDANGKATVEFELPDNLTNFRVMVISQGVSNFFGYGETMIEVRKDVLLESRVPQIMRFGDKVTLGANVFNSTDKEIGFLATLVSTDLQIEKPEQKIVVPAGESIYVTWNTQLTSGCDDASLLEDCMREYTMSILGDSAKHSDKLVGDFTIAKDPIILQNQYKDANIDPQESVELSLQKTDNTDIEKSKFSLTLENNPLSGIDSMYRSLMRYPYGCVEQLLSSTLPNAILQRFKTLGVTKEINQEYLDRNLALGYEKILKLQNPDGGFKYWSNDFTSDIEITPHVLRNLIELRDAEADVDDGVLSSAVEYLTKNTSPATPEHIRLEALWAVSKYLPNRKATVLEKFSLSDLSSFDISKMSQHELLSYTYALLYLDKNGYSNQIAANIKTLLAKTKPVQNHLYYSDLEDRALLASLMIDFGMKQSELTDIILELYEKKWRSYWISTKSKNAAFMAFVKYMETYGTRYQNNVVLKLGDETKDYNIDSDLGMVEIEYKLAEILSGAQVPIYMRNATGNATVFSKSNIEIYPLDPLAIEPHSSRMRVERIIYEVVDETKIEEKCSWDTGTKICTQPSGLKLHSSDTFDSGKTYKVVLKANFDQDIRRTNLTLEDYLPAGFTVLNSNFLTNSIATSQASTQNTWRWNQTQIRPELVMANAKYSWGTSSEYSYFVRADYPGEFLYPPLAGYLMYEPSVRANTSFRRITIK